MKKYVTLDEAKSREIIDTLGDWADQHDIDAIAAEVFTTIGQCADQYYILRDDVDFWEAVARHAKITA